MCRLRIIINKGRSWLAGLVVWPTVRNPSGFYSNRQSIKVKLYYLMISFMDLRKFNKGGNIYFNFNICDMLGKRYSRSFLTHRFIQEASRMQLLNVPQQCHCQCLCWWRNTQISRDWLHFYSSSNRTFLTTGNISLRVFSISSLYFSPIILTLESRAIVLLLNKQICVALGAKKERKEKTFILKSWFYVC